MSRKSTSDSVLVFISFITLLIFSAFSHEDHEQPKTFIIHVSKSEKPQVFNSHVDWYTSTLQSLPPSVLSSSENGRSSPEIIYAYDHAIHGFSARLTPFQASHLEIRPGIVSVVPERIHKFYTTHTPEFLGLSSSDPSGLWLNSDYGVDVIIGVVDSGIWPQHPSFNDSGLGPIPKRWKGTCEAGPDFPATSCNRKLIGARAFYKGYEEWKKHRVDEDGKESRSPLDTDGHGTHCASTAAGASVKNAGYHKHATGEARGIATKARIAAYKYGWGREGTDSDVLAALDQAIADGVDVISLSAGVENATIDTDQYYQNAIAIGAFSAMEKGILVSCATGNSGPATKTAENVAPWILTVGASTIDREFPADVILGDGQVFPGSSLYSGDTLPYTEIVYAPGDHPYRAYCLEGSLSSTEVAGKIVICDAGGISGEDKGTVVKNAGGAGMIVIGDGEYLRLDFYPIPAAGVSKTSGAKIIEYINNHSHGQQPTATINFRGTVIGSFSSPAPKVAGFSSRGPNRVTPEILKPDVIAPGVDILAAKTGYGADPTSLEEFTMMSGTSMACPHVSGLAALLRKVYPTWSPAAIRSALMTTAYDVDNSGKYITDTGTGKFSTPFQHGSGHVEPNRALNPGLVYDIGPSDYEAFLCSIGYDAKQISVFFKDRKVDCKSIGLSSPGNLNYPSFSVVFKSWFDTVKYKRVVKNVGSSVDAVYKVKVRSRTPSVKISVSPNKLVFSKDKTSLAYEITFESKPTDVDTAKEAFGSIEWYDGVHVVKSPIAFKWGVTSTSLISSV